MLWRLGWEDLIDTEVAEPHRQLGVRSRKDGIRQIAAVHGAHRDDWE